MVLDVDLFSTLLISATMDVTAGALLSLYAAAKRKSLPSLRLLLLWASVSSVCAVLVVVFLAQELLRFEKLFESSFSIIAVAIGVSFVIAGIKDTVAAGRRSCQYRRLMHEEECAQNDSKFRSIKLEEHVTVPQAAEQAESHHVEELLKDSSVHIQGQNDVAQATSFPTNSIDGSVKLHVSVTQPSKLVPTTTFGWRMRRVPAWACTLIVSGEMALSGALAGFIGFGGGTLFAGLLVVQTTLDLSSATATGCFFMFTTMLAFVISVLSCGLASTEGLWRILLCNAACEGTGTVIAMAVLSKIPTHFFKLTIGVIVLLTATTTSIFTFLNHQEASVVSSSSVSGIFDSSTNYSTLLG